MSTKFFLLFAFIATLGACRVTLVPDYDNEIAKQIVHGAKANDKLYLELLADSNDNRSYKNHEKEYIEIEAEINSIKLENAVLKKNKDMLGNIEVLHSHFIKYRDEHKNASQPLSNAAIIDYENDISAFWESLLYAEKGLPKPADK